MHSRKKGKSGSTKPTSPVKPSWLRHSEQEIELIITKLSKEGKSPSQIGVILRDIYGIPYVGLVLKKSITEVLASKKISAEIPEDLLALVRKAVLVRKHMDKNSHDMTAKRGLQLTESKIQRLTKYYRRISRLAQEWKYDPATATMYLE